MPSNNATFFCTNTTQSCYKFVVKAANFSRAHQFCRKQGGALVTYGGLDEQLQVERCVCMLQPAPGSSSEPARPRCKPHP
jgi:hypothetical protein